MARSGVRLVLGMAAVMWVLEIIDAVTRHTLDGYGILPRTIVGLPGVIAAPFLHLGFAHLAANTVPFIALGVIIAIGGAARVLTVTAIAAAVSGLAVWLLAPTRSVTVGASGIVFGFAAYLIVRGLVSRRVGQLVVGALVILVFGTGLLVGLLPRAGISWVGHLFGAIGGAAAARVLHDGTDAPVSRS